MVVSSVDISKLDEATMGSVVEYCYGAASEEKQKAILDRLLAVKERIHPDR